MKHIIFDLHNTLIYKKMSYSDILLNKLSEKGISHLVSKKSLELFDKQITDLIFSDNTDKFNLSEGKSSWLQVFNESIKELGLNTDIDTKELTLNIYQVLEHSDYWSVYPDVHESLKFLKEKNVSYGFLSNWDNRMSNLWNGLSKMLNSENEIALFSYQTNTCKPNPLFFKSYIDLANERYNNITSFVKVGDDLKTDKGGESIGVNFLHVYRKDKNFNLAEALKSIL